MSFQVILSLVLTTDSSSVGKKFSIESSLFITSSKDQQVWVEGLGDLVILELATMGILYSGRAGWLEVDGGIYIPLPEK